jgi:GT2 family glycosyltransferase
MTVPSISIVIAYYERPIQLRNTLYSFVEHSYGRNVEVVVVDDGSTSDEATIPDFSFSFELKILKMPADKKWYKNSCVPYNCGFINASGSVILLQNAECFHYDNIVKHALEHANDNNYLSYACYSLNSESTSSLTSSIAAGKGLEGVDFKYSKPIRDGGEGWYNHSKHNPVGYHFCAAITMKNLRRLGGFDEKYARGIGYDDNEFLHRVQKLPLSIEIVDSAVVLHQHHYTETLLGSRLGKYYDRNRLLYEVYTLDNRKSRGYLKFVLMFYVLNIPRLKRLLIVFKRLSVQLLHLVQRRK